MTKILFMIDSILSSIIEGKEKVLEKYLKFLNTEEFSELNENEDIGKEDLIYKFNSSSEYYELVKEEDEFISDIEINQNSKYKKQLINFMEKLGCERQDDQSVMFFTININSTQKSLIKNISETFNPQKFIDKINQKFDDKEKENQGILNSINQENQELFSEFEEMQKKLNNSLKEVYKDLTKSELISQEKKHMIYNLIKDLELFPEGSQTKKLVNNIKSFLYEKCEEVVPFKKMKFS